MKVLFTTLNPFHWLMFSFMMSLKFLKDRWTMKEVLTKFKFQHQKLHKISEIIKIWASKLKMCHEYMNNNLKC